MKCNQKPIAADDRPATRVVVSVPGRLSSREAHAKARGLLLVAIAFYVAFYLVVYLSSPAGRYPVLDAAENLSLAGQIAEHTLPAEPFYRAMLYPSLLSVFLLAGVTANGLPVAASIVGGAFHLGSAFCVYWLARRTWASARAGLVAAALFGFNPVAVYFAAEPLDTCFGLFLFLAGLNLLQAMLLARCRTAGKSAVNAYSAPSRLWFGVAGGTALWVLAMLARPHYAITLAGLPLLLVALLWRAPRRLIGSLVAFTLVAGIGLGATGLLQRKICGKFRIMPTQGAYSLWAGNRPGANGRYYEQQIHIPAGSAAEGQNPARIESELLYRRETGESGPLNIDHLNNYWRSKTLATIRAEPTVWLGLMVHKVYFLLNDFEQYNNKTFAIQKALSPGLRFNPLGWGITLLLCASGLTLAAMKRRVFAGLVFLAGIGTFYAVGVVLFFVSDRFRLPLLPFVCIGAGMWGVTSRSWLSSLGGYRILALVLVLLTAAGGTFSRAWGVHDLSPAVQDEVLLAIAARKAGDDLQSLCWARHALERQADHPDALACAVTGFYNAKLQGLAPEQEFPDESWGRQFERVTRIPQPASGVRLVQAVALWKTGRSSQARELLLALLNPASPEQSTNSIIGDDALGVLLLAVIAEAGDEVRARERAERTTSFYLLEALRRRETSGKSLVPASSRERVRQAEAFVRNIFP